MTNPSQTIIKAEIAIREAAADFMAELEKADTSAQAHAIWKRASDAENYLATVTNSAGKRHEHLIAQENAAYDARR